MQFVDTKYKDVTVGQGAVIADSLSLRTVRASFPAHNSSLAKGFITKTNYATDCRP